MGRLLANVEAPRAGVGGECVRGGAQRGRRCRHPRRRSHLGCQDYSQVTYLRLLLLLYIYFLIFVFVPIFQS